MWKFEPKMVKSLEAIRLYSITATNLVLGNPNSSSMLNPKMGVAYKNILAGQETREPHIHFQIYDFEI